MLNKKGDLSINIVIVAAIALIVLIVMIAIFVGRTGTFVKVMDDCPGTCVDSKDQCQGEYQKIDNFKNCPGENEVCCITILRT